MLNAGICQITTSADNWTAVTKHDKIYATFEYIFFMIEKLVVLKDD